MPFRLFTQKNRAVGMLPVVQLAVVFFLVVSSTLPALAQQPLGDKPFTNYFVTGDYVVGGWVEASSVNGFATGTISIPDPKQPNAGSLPAGADIVAAYLYWGTVEGSQSSFAAQHLRSHPQNVLCSSFVSAERSWIHTAHARLTMNSSPIEIPSESDDGARSIP